MLERSFYRSLVVKILVIPLIALAVAVLGPGLLGYRLLHGDAQDKTKEQALLLLRAMDAADRYTLENAEAGKMADTRCLRPSGAMMRRYLAGASGAQYQFRQVAANALNQSDEPDENEARMITAFQADRSLRRIDAEVERGGVRYQTVATPVVATMDRCVSCHSAPTTAAEARLAKLGVAPHWRKGQVVGATVAYVPMDAAADAASGIFWTVTKLIVLLCLVSMGLLAWQVRQMIAKPIAVMVGTARAIRKGEWAARFKTNNGDELNTLAMVFQDTTYWLRQQVAREEKLRAMFQQFIPASVAARTLGKDADAVLAGTVHPVTVMIINIRNFKLLMEHLPPEQTVNTLNEFFSSVNHVIVANKGLVSKYLGDTVMAFFGMPLGNDDHALNAVKAAMQIPQALQDLYVRLDEQHGWELGVGIGITTGEPIVGHFGSTEHMEYTVLGDVVVEAHRLEEISKSVPEEDTVFISEATYREVMSDVHVFDMGEKTVKDGKVIHVYAVQGMRSEARSVLAA